MGEVDKEELEKMSKSKFGKYNSVPENKLLKSFYNIFLKNTTFRAYANGAVTAGVIIYGTFTKEYQPLYIWLGYLVFINLGEYYYWRYERGVWECPIRCC